MSIEQAVQQVRAFYKENVAQRHPFKNHLINQYDERTQDVYFTMLTALMQFANEPSDAQQIFIQRLIEGTERHVEIEYYARKASEMDEEFAEEFYQSLHNQPIVINFIVDALVLIYSTTTSKREQAEFLSEIIVLFQIEEQTLRQYTLIAHAILEMNQEKLNEVYFAREKCRRTQKKIHKLASLPIVIIIFDAKVRS